VVRQIDRLRQELGVGIVELAFIAPGADNVRRSLELFGTHARRDTGARARSTERLGTSFGGKLALWLAVQASAQLDALVLESAMRELHVPTLVLFGTEDRLTPLELRRHYRELMPDAHFVIVYDAAHAVYADRPEAFAAIVADFLEHRAEFVVRRESGLLYP
jgi:dienelactone hydrolase